MSATPDAALSEPDRFTIYRAYPAHVCRAAASANDSDGPLLLKE
jgi:hypothetical protein